MLWAYEKLPCEMCAKFWPISIGISLCSSASLIQIEEMSVMMMSVLRSQLDIPNNVPVICICYLPAGSNCDLGLENMDKIFFSKLSTEKKNSWKKTHASITLTVVRDRKIRTALRTNQIVGFVTVPAWKK